MLRGRPGSWTPSVSVVAPHPGDRGGLTAASPEAFPQAPSPRQDSTQVPPTHQSQLHFPKLYFIKCTEEDTAVTFFFLTKISYDISVSKALRQEEAGWGRELR